MSRAAAGENVESAIRKRVAETLALVEKGRTKTCDERDVGTTLRHLGLNPRQDQLQKILEEIRTEDNVSTAIDLEALERVLVVILTERKGDYLRDSYDQILCALRAFDPEGKGFIDVANLKYILTSRGESFKVEEVEAMLKDAAEEETGKIWIEDYAEMLAFSGLPK